MKRGYFFAMAATVLVSSANAELANRIALPGFYVGGNIGYVTARVDEASTGRQVCVSQLDGATICQAGAIDEVVHATGADEQRAEEILKKIQQFDPNVDHGQCPP